MSTSTQNKVEITAQNLPLTCPMPGSTLWNSHPKVTLALNHDGEAQCPYCGTLYKFTGEMPQSHH